MDSIQGAGALNAQRKLPEDKSAVAPDTWQGSYGSKVGTEAYQCVVQKNPPRTPSYLPCGRNHVVAHVTLQDSY